MFDMPGMCVTHVRCMCVTVRHCVTRCHMSYYVCYCDMFVFFLYIDWPVHIQLWC